MQNFPITSLSEKVVGFPIYFYFFIFLSLKAHKRRKRLSKLLGCLQGIAFFKAIKLHIKVQVQLFCFHFLFLFLFLRFQPTTKERKQVQK